MGIKLSDYIKDPKQALTEDDWITIYTHALIDNAEMDEILAEELMEASNEALQIEFENGSIIQSVEVKGEVIRGVDRFKD